MELLRTDTSTLEKRTTRPLHARAFSAVMRQAVCSRRLRERGRPRTPQGSRIKPDAIDNRDAEP
jgi:hypothetical protein